MFLLSKVVRTNLFIQYCLTFSRNSHKCIYRSLTGYPNGCASELYWEKSTLDIKTCHFMELLYNFGQ